MTKAVSANFLEKVVQKSLRDSLQEPTEAIVQTVRRASESESGSLPSSFVPLHTCTPIKSIKAARSNNSSLPVNVVNPSQTSSMSSKNPKQRELKEPGVVVSKKNCLILIFSKSVTASGLSEFEVIICNSISATLSGSFLNSGW